jgi:cobalamin biosynthesis Mg chelatase CobN
VFFDESPALTTGAFAAADAPEEVGRYQTRAGGMALGAPPPAPMQGRAPEPAKKRAERPAPKSPSVSPYVPTPEERAAALSTSRKRSPLSSWALLVALLVLAALAVLVYRALAGGAPASAPWRDVITHPTPAAPR